MFVPTRNGNTVCLQVGNFLSDIANGDEPDLAAFGNLFVTHGVIKRGQFQARM
jgi:hypothetical protein